MDQHRSDNFVLRLSSIFKSFDAVRALRGVSFDLRGGEVHAIVGENGAGKSTLIKVISGAIAPDSGSIHIAGQRVDSNSPAVARARGVAVIYQQPALFADLSVAENIAVRLEPPGGLRRVRWDQRRQRAGQLLSRVGADIDPDRTVRTLSMPQQQLVEIAAALGASARILILDEPTASLGHREAEHLLTVVRRLRDEGVGIVYISHRLDEVARIADRITVLRDGTHIATRDANSIDRAELIRLMVGRPLDAMFPKPDVPIRDEFILEARGLCSDEAGVRDASFAVRSGEILGLAGLVGAGRTELARVLFGLSPADAGQIIVRGKTVRIDRPADAIACGIAYVPEDRRRHGVVPEMSIAANTTLATLPRISRFGALIDFAAERAVADRFVARLGTKTPSVDQPVSHLSGGNQQKVALARWLATEPAVLILDEPTQGVDVAAKAEIHRLVGELAGRGIAIVMISSELPELLGICDRIAVMRAGRIVATLDRASATQEAVLELALHDTSDSPDRAAAREVPA